MVKGKKLQKNILKIFSSTLPTMTEPFFFLLYFINYAAVNQHPMSLRLSWKIVVLVPSIGINRNALICIPF